MARRRMIPTLLIRRAAVVILQAGLLSLVLLLPVAAAAGDLDTTFGGDGRVVTGFAGDASGFAAAIQADGKIVAAGELFPEGVESKFALARYRPSGALDPTFGGDGRVVTGFPGDTSANGAFLAIQTDGKIVAVGVVSGPGEFGKNRFALVRYTRSGALDPTFGGDGRVVTGFAGHADARGVAIQAGGKIVAAGSVFIPSLQRTKFALARYRPSGALDPTFGGDGRVVTGFAGDAEHSGVAIQADGKIVAGGTLFTDDAVMFALARYRPSGALDPTFGGDGRVVTGFRGGGTRGEGVAIQADGKIVAGGTLCCPGGRLKFALARYRPSGELDPTFGGDGRVTTGFAGDASAHGVAIQGDGKIVAVGSFGPSGERKFALARYLAV
jgi:uncharacterized delta-60 repeat protein